MPQVPWAAAPRASSRSRLAAWWAGVMTGHRASISSRSQASRDAERLQVGGLVEQRVRLDQHEPRQQRPDAGHECAAAELGERVVAAVGRDDVVPGLRAAVESDDGVGAVAAGEEIDDRALAAVAEGEVDDRGCRHAGLAVTAVAQSVRVVPSCRAVQPASARGAWADARRSCGRRRRASVRSCDAVVDADRALVDADRQGDALGGVLGVLQLDDAVGADSGGSRSPGCAWSPPCEAPPGMTK